MKFNKTLLPNGLRIITIPMADNPSVTVLVMAETGSEYEDREDGGISHLLEHMVFKGTPRRPKASDISREFDSIGAQSNAFTGQESTGYHAKVASRLASVALDIIVDMYLNPLLDPAEMEKEKGVIVEEMRMYQDMPQAEVGNLFSELVYGDQPAGRRVIGTETIVRGISRNRLYEYRKSHYGPASTIVIVSGSFDEKNMIADIQKAFLGASLEKEEKKPKPPIDDSQKGPAVKISYKETDQTHLVLGIRSFPAASEHRYALAILSTLLGRSFSSRLFAKLREEMGVCYYVHAENESFKDHGLFAVSAGVDNKRIGEVIQVILAELGALLREPVPSAELTKVKDYMAGTLALSLETSDALAHYAGSEEALVGMVEDPAAAIAGLRAVTAEEVMELARLIFVDAHLNLAIIGPFKDDGRFKKLLSFKNPIVL
jgi:predicted Zn-dependent peptidase